MDDSVHIDHRNYFESIVIVAIVLFLACLCYTFQQILYDIFYHITGGRLNGVLPSKNPHDFGVFDMLFPRGY